MADESTNNSGNGDLKAALRAEGDRDLIPAQQRPEDEDAGGADLVKSAEGTALFHGLNGNGDEPVDGGEDDSGDRDPWLASQLRKITPTLPQRASRHIPGLH